MLPAAAVLLSESAGQTFDRLESSSNSSEQAVARRARALKPLLLVDCLHGEVVRKSAIPPALKARYGLDNMYVEDLPSFWRLLYTIVKIDGRRTVVIVERVSHRTYNKWFPGRRR